MGVLTFQVILICSQILEQLNQVHCFQKKKKICKSVDEKGNSLEGYDVVHRHEIKQYSTTFG